MVRRGERGGFVIVVPCRAVCFLTSAVSSLVFLPSRAFPVPHTLLVSGLYVCLSPLWPPPPLSISIWRAKNPNYTLARRVPSMVSVTASTPSANGHCHCVGLVPHQ